MSKHDIDALERSHPKRYILPMSATQITTMATYIAQVLFGQETPWKVEGRRPEDDVPAELVNNLLRWNAEQQSTYQLVKNGIPFNAIMTKNLVNHLFLNEMEEWAYPGKRKNDLRQIKKDTGATPLW